MAQSDNVSADDMVAAIDTGGRDPVGAMRNLIPVVAFIWALFQMYIASNFPFTLTEFTGISFVVTNSNARLIHLAFGFFLASMAFPLMKSSPARPSHNPLPRHGYGLVDGASGGAAGGLTVGRSSSGSPPMSTGRRRDPHPPAPSPRMWRGGELPSPSPFPRVRSGQASPPTWRGGN